MEIKNMSFDAEPRPEIATLERVPLQLPVALLDRMKATLVMANELAPAARSLAETVVDIWHDYDKATDHLESDADYDAMHKWSGADPLLIALLSIVGDLLEGCRDSIPGQSPEWVAARAAARQETA